MITFDDTVQEIMCILDELGAGDLRTYLISADCFVPIAAVDVKIGVMPHQLNLHVEMGGQGRGYTDPVIGEFAEFRRYLAQFHHPQSAGWLIIPLCSCFGRNDLVKALRPIATAITNARAFLPPEVPR